MTHSKTNLIFVIVTISVSSFILMTALIHRKPSLEKVAIFFQSQPSKQSIEVVLKFMKVLKDWKFQLFLTKESRSSFEEEKQIAFGISKKRIIITILPVFDRIWYMQTQLNVSFWEDVVMGDFVLLFHPDSMVCKESPHKIEDFFS